MFSNVILMFALFNNGNEANREEEKTTMKRLKQFFKTPQRTVISLLCLAAVIALLGTGTVFAATTIAKSSSIGEENAKNFAFADLGIDPLSAQNVHEEFDFEQGHFVYEIEFMAKGVEYEYWIKASDGAIVKKEMDIATQEEGVQPVQESKPQTVAETEPQTVQQSPKDGSKEETTDLPAADVGQQDSSAEIGLDAAKKIAISDAGVSDADVAYTKTKLEYEEGVQVYEIEFYTSTDEYEYEINATTGVIRSKDKEEFHNDIEGDHHTNTGADIAVEQAKSIAANHAGFSVSEVSFSKAKLEKGDGNIIYEVKFYKDGMEYEYEILAATGEILKFDSERDD